MGTWDVKAFDNDSACDWAWELAESDDLSVIEAALDVDPIDGSMAENALAACEVLARLKGRPGYSNAYTEDVDAWVAAHPIKPPQQLMDRAIAVIDAILSDESELAQLWAENRAEHGKWREAVKDLRGRLTT